MDAQTLAKLRLTVSKLSEGNPERASLQTSTSVIDNPVNNNLPRPLPPSFQKIQKSKSLLELLREKMEIDRVLKDHSQKKEKEKETEEIASTRDFPSIQNTSEDKNPIETTDRFGTHITLNSLQQQFVCIAGIEGKSAVLIGAAGTGKTTSQKAVTQELIRSGNAGILDAQDHSHLKSGTPGIIICAYTRRAVANIRKNLPTDLQANAITIHKLLEYQPVYDTVIDPVTGDERTKMSFQATRGPDNPLPSSIRTIIFEEGSMLSTDLYKEVKNACPHEIQEIFLGDIQQLPPVFGPAILGFKLLELPVIELTEVYRQALESPIIKLAHRVLSGDPISPEEFPSWNYPGQLFIRPWKQKLSPDNGLFALGHVLKSFYDAGAYNPEEDMILLPFNKGLGTIELNKILANHIARKHGETTYEIIAGFQTLYLSPGDKVLYDKEDAIIISIEENPTYTGKVPQAESSHLDYWGQYQKIDGKLPPHLSPREVDMDALLSSVASSVEGDDRVNQGSHIISLRMLDSDQIVKVQTAGDINSLLLGYALTIHKAQGSEFSKVFCVFHNSHATMVQRELLYTAITRAKKELYIICEPETFIKGITGQRVKGNTIEDKANYFKGKLNEGFEL